MLKNMQINTRLILSFMVVVALLIITGVVSLVMLSRVGAALCADAATPVRQRKNTAAQNSASVTRPMRTAFRFDRFTFSIAQN